MVINDVEVSGLTSDFRKIKPGFAFVAIKEKGYDGNKYIEEAIKQKASIIFTENNINKHDVKIVKVDNVKEVFIDLLNRFYDYPLDKIDIIGAIGESGKTTTVHMIDYIFSETDKKTGIISSMINKIHDDLYPVYTNTIRIETLYKYLWEMTNKRLDIAIIEIPVEIIHQYSQIAEYLNVAIFTSYFSEIDDLSAVKSFLRSLNKKSVLVINAEQESAISLTENLNIDTVLTCSLGSKTHISASSLNYGKITEFIYCILRELRDIKGDIIECQEFPVEINIMGKHNLENILSSITTCMYYGVKSKEIQKIMKDFTGVKGRMELVYDQEYTVIDDRCSTPESYEMVFESIQNIDYKELCIIHSVMGGKGIGLNKKIAQVLSSWASILDTKKVFITDSKDVTDMDNIVHEEERNIVLSTLREKNMEFEYYFQLFDCIRESIKLLKKDDLLLLLGGQGMEKGSEFILELMVQGHDVNNLLGMEKLEFGKYDI